MKLPVIVRLGGFHLLKSYLGSLGYIMKDSGLEELFQRVFTQNQKSSIRSCRVITSLLEHIS